MIDKLEQVELRFEKVNELICEPEVVNDQNQYKELMRELKNLTPVVECFRAYKEADKTEKEALELLSDASQDKDFKELLEEEYKESKQKKEELYAELKTLLLPKDPNDYRNVIIEIRGGAGGDEAALFAGSLFRMYSMYAESRGWKTDVMNINETGLGGIKEISFMIEGEGAYSRFKFESGVHRVQRVPVAVLPEAEEVDIAIDPSELQIDTFRASGAGGQHVNKTESAIRITHLPTGTVVECQDERSQHKNKDRALKILRSRLLEVEREKQDSEIADERRSQVGTGDRSERIRTYNFPQGRVSDHRIGLTLYKIEAIMNGDIDELVDALVTADTAQKLQAAEG